MMTVSLTMAPPEENRLLGLALGLAGVTVFSLTLPFTRLAVAGFDATTVAAWRALIAALAAAVVLLVTRSPWPKRSDLAPLAVTAFGVVLGFPVLTTLAMRTVSASHGGVVVGLLPLATAGFAVLIAQERPSAGFWLAAMLGAAATVLFVLRQAEGGAGGGGVEIGHLLLLAAVAAAGLGYAAGARMARRMAGWRVICWSLTLSLPFIALAACLTPAPSLAAPAVAWAALLYLALMSQLLGFFVWYRALAIGGVARVGQVQLLQLFLTLIASALMLGERPGGEAWLFGAVVVGCVALAGRLRVSRRR